MREPDASPLVGILSPDAAIRVLLARTVQRGGFRASTLTLAALGGSGGRVRLFLREQQPAVVIYHLVEPFAVTGTELHRLLREVPDLGARLVVVTTGPEELLQTVGRLAAAAVVPLPLPDEALLQAVRRALGGA